MKKLSRRRARAIILLSLLGLLAAVLGAALYMREAVLAGMGAMLTGVLLRFFLLTCPNCGYHAAVPQWRKSGTVHCPQCGELFEYDDESRT